MNPPSRAGHGTDSWPAVLACIREGILLVKADGTIQFANDPCLRLFHLPADVIGQPLSTALSEPSIEALANATFSGDETQEQEIMITRAGRARSLSVRASKLEDISPGETGAVLVFQDITEQRALEKIGSNFVANVSHELRTPVSIVAGYIENLADFPRMPRAEQVEIFGIMQEHATRLKALLDDLLTLAFLESHRDVLNYADLDLGQFFDRLAKDWQTALAGKEMTVVLEVAEDARIIPVDRFRFEQVIHNLFDNAFKYTPNEGRIRVRTARANGTHLEITIEDNGAGIPQEDLPHIFERFYRVDKARSRKYGGAGLGLSIVKHIVALHGGSVRAESTVGMSTRVTVCFPLTPPAA